MAKETTLTRISTDKLKKANEIVASDIKYDNVRQLLDVLIEQEYKKLKREARKAE